MCTLFLEIYSVWTFTSFTCMILNYYIIDESHMICTHHILCLYVLGLWSPLKKTGMENFPWRFEAVEIPSYSWVNVTFEWELLGPLIPLLNPHWRTWGWCKWVSWYFAKNYMGGCHSLLTINKIYWARHISRLSVHGQGGGKWGWHLLL